MDGDKFATTVADRAGWCDQQEARQASRVVLEVLGERDLKGEAANLGAQLPGEFKSFLTNPETPGDEKFGRDEFLRRVSQRLDFPDEDAAILTRAVLSTAADAATDNERIDFLHQLPHDLRNYAIHHDTAESVAGE